MRVTALILAAIATLTMDAGIFIYWAQTAFACFDVCPPASTFANTWLRMLATSVLPGIILAVAASVVAIIALRAERRSAALVVAVLTPILSAVAVALTLYFVAGGFTPLANPGPPEVAPQDRQLWQPWIGGTAYAVLSQRRLATGDVSRGADSPGQAIGAPAITRRVAIPYGVVYWRLARPAGNPQTLTE